MEGLTRLVAESFARHGFDRPLDYRRLRWSRWFRCESLHSLLFVPSKPGIFALSEEIMTFGGSASSATAEATTAEATTAEATTAPEAKTFGRGTTSVVPSAPPKESGFQPLGSAFAAVTAPDQKRMLAVLQFTEADDMAYTLDRLLSRENPMRARLLSGRIFIRYVAIDDDAQRRSTAAALNQWLQSSSEAATGIGAHFATSLELTPNDSPNIHSPTSLPSGF